VSGHQWISCPILDHSVHPRRTVLCPIHFGEIIELELLNLASSLNDPAVPNSVQYSSRDRTKDLRIVATIVLAVANMAGLVRLLNAVQQEPQCKPSLLDRPALVLHYQSELVDFIDLAAVLRIVGRPLSIAGGFIQGTST
jgi:hypothetical protein